MTAVADRIRALPQRHGRKTLILLALIAVLGLGLRAYAVVNPVANPADDSHAYYALSKALYEEGSYGGPNLPQLERLVARGAAALRRQLLRDRRRPRRDGPDRRGAARDRGDRRRLPRSASAGRSDAGRVGLLAAFAVAVYPPFIHSTGELMSEPPAILTLPAAVLAFLWASERSGRRWCLAGAGPAVRPDGDVPARVPARRRRLRRPRRDPGRAGGAAGGRASPARPARRSPCCCRSSPGRSATSTCSAAWCRSRPAAARRSTSAPSCPPTANTSGSRRCCYQRYRHRDLAPDSEALNEVDPTPLFNRVAARYPDLPRDSALGKIGKQNFSKYFGEDPLGYLGMTARKVGRMWSSGVGEAMSSDARPRRADPARRARARRLRPARTAPPLVGAGGAGDADRPRHRWSARPRWRRRGATRC